MKYYIRIDGDLKFDEIEKDQYLHLQNQAGFYIGDKVLMPSFFDRERNIRGYIKNE